MAFKLRRANNSIVLDLANKLLRDETLHEDMGVNFPVCHFFILL